MLLLGLATMGVESQSAAAEDNISSRRVADLEDGDPQVREQAVRAITQDPATSPAMVARVVELANDPHANVRAMVYAGLAGMKSRARCAAPALISLYSNPGLPSWDRERAMEAVGAITSPKADAVPSLMKALGDKNAGIRWSAAEALGEIGSAAAPAIPLIWDMAQNDPMGGWRWTNRLHARVVLAEIGRPAVAMLVDALNGTDVFQRRVAAETLFQTTRCHRDYRDLAPALTKALVDEDAWVRLDSAKALWELNQDESAVVPVLTALLDKATEAIAKPARLSGLPKKEMAESTAAFQQALAAARQREDALFIGQSAAYALGEIGPRAEAAVPHLVTALGEDTDIFLQHDATEALGKIGAPARQAVPSLMKLRWHKQPFLRKASVAALQRIDPKATLPVADLVADIRAGSPNADGAIDVLGEVSKEDRRKAASLLVPLLEDQGADVRERAVRALEGIGSEASIVEESLKDLARNGTPQVREAASRVLRTIEFRRAREKLLGW